MMWWSPRSVLLLLLTPALAGCLGDTEVTAPDSPLDAVSIGVGEHLNWTFEGTGWWQTTIRPTGHLNVRLTIDHPTVTDWCRDDPDYPADAHTAVAVFQTAPMREGSGVVRWSTTDHQWTRAYDMRRPTDCHEGEVFVARAGETWTLLVSTTVEGLSVGLRELRSEADTEPVPVKLMPHPGFETVAPEATATDGLWAGGSRVMHATEWRHEVTGGPIWVWALHWRDLDPSPVPQGPGVPGYYDSDWRLTIETDGEPNDMNPYAGGASGGGAWWGAHFVGRTTANSGNHTITLIHEETTVTPLDHEEGVVFLVLPLSR